MNFVKFLRKQFVKHLWTAGSEYCYADINLKKGLLLYNWFLIHLIQFSHKHKNKRSTFDSFVNLKQNLLWFLFTCYYATLQVAFRMITIDLPSETIPVALICPIFLLQNLLFLQFEHKPSEKKRVGTISL